MKAVQSRSARMLSLLKTSPLPEPPFLDSVVIDVFPVGSAFFFGVDRGNPGRVPERLGTCSGSGQGWGYRTGSGGEVSGRSGQVLGAGPGEVRGGFRCGFGSGNIRSPLQSLENAFRAVSALPHSRGFD